MAAETGDLLLRLVQQPVDGIPDVAVQLIQAVLILAGVEDTGDDVGAPDDLSVQCGHRVEQRAGVQVVGVEHHRGGADVDGAAVEQGSGVARFHRQRLPAVGHKGDLIHRGIGHQLGKGAQKAGRSGLHVGAAVGRQQLGLGHAALGEGGREPGAVGGAALGHDGRVPGELVLFQVDGHVAVHQCPAGEDSLADAVPLDLDGALAAGAPAAADQIHGETGGGTGLGDGHAARRLKGGVLVGQFDRVHESKPPV